MKDYVQAHPFQADVLVYYADHGSEDADLILRELIAEYVDRGEKLTAVLAAYNVRLLNPSRPKKRSGPTRAANLLRDIGIAALVMMLIDNFGLRPHRNEATERPSALSIVATALTRAGIEIKPPGVSKVWQRFLPAFAGTRYAIGTRFEVGFRANYTHLFSR